MAKSTLQPANSQPGQQRSLKKVALKNSKDTVFLDEKVFHWLSTDPHLKSMDFINNLRKHSSGCAVFQKTRRIEKGQYETETIYLHKLIAEQFLTADKTPETGLAGMISENKLDCRLQNLIWRSRAEASRLRRSTGKSGFLGVYQESRRFRAVISFRGKAVHIGMFDSAEEAAEAFNKASAEFFGADAKLNML